MNIIDKLIDTRQINDQSMNRSDLPLFNFPDFRNWPDSLIGPSGSLLRGNMFPITPNQLSRSLKLSTSNVPDLIPGLTIKDCDNDKNSDDEDFCEKCQKKFCNKYYLRKHKIEVHKLDAELDSPYDNIPLLGESQQKSPLFRPSPFAPFINSSFSNFLFQKSMAPMFANLLLPQAPLPQLSQHNSDFNTPSSSSILSQSIFRTSQATSLLNNPDLNTSCNNSFPLLPSSEPNSKLPNLATSILNEVRNSFIKSPIETKPFFNVNMLENGFPDLNRVLSQSITCTICNIQINGGESAFLDHLYSCHNNDKSSNLSPNSKIPPKKDSPLSPVTNCDSYISPFDAFKSSMAAAKLADRVTCDICHKDLCNKYFLRTHKLKLHGIQTLDNNCRSGTRKEKTGLFDQQCPTQFDQLNTTTPNFLTSPFPRSSLPDHLLATSMFPNPSLPTPVSSEQGCFCPICKRLVSLPYFLPLHLWNVHGIGMRNPAGFLPPVSDARSNLDGSSLEHNFLPKIGPTMFPLPFGNSALETSSIGSKWYRKSPNQMRVRCDICDKWICNKYFLRTHKLNKHGLNDNVSNTDVNSDSLSRGFFGESSNIPTATVKTHCCESQNVSDNSPIDLSASPTRENTFTKTSTTATHAETKVPRNSLMTDFNLKSFWNVGLSQNWPLRFSMDRLQNSSLFGGNANNTAPLDLSTKLDKNATKCNSNNRDPSNSLIIATAKRLKIKYQKLYRVRICRQLSQISNKKSTSFNHATAPALKSECFNCPLCGKELQDAPRFLQHLTQFHDMVLPGNHSGSSVSSKNF